jgi:hypothetical protein
MKLVRNAIQTPDGTVLSSFAQHDYKTHTDKNGYEYMVDGGLAYARSGNSPDAPQATPLYVHIEDGIEKVRDAVTWGTYGKSGDEPFRRVKLSEMSNAHIQACLDTQTMMHPHLREAFKMEIAYRTANVIMIED